MEGKDSLRRPEGKLHEGINQEDSYGYLLVPLNNLKSLVGRL